MSTRDYVPGQVCTVRDDAKLYNYPGGLSIGQVDPPFERADDYSSCAYFYLDRPENGLPALATAAERMKGL